MLDAIPWEAVGYGSGWTAFVGLALWIVRRYSTGKWVPRETVEKDREMDLQALAAERATNAELRSAVIELIPLARLSAHSLQSIRTDPEGGEHK